jgi:hypothetical protein
MKLEYRPLLTVQRELQSIPRSRARFHQYLRTIFSEDRKTIELLPGSVRSCPWRSWWTVSLGHRVGCVSPRAPGGGHAKS